MGTWEGGKGGAVCLGTRLKTKLAIRKLEIDYEPVNGRGLREVEE